MRIGTGWLAASILVVVLVTASCGSSESTTASSLTARPSSTAVLSITSPKDGETIHGSTVDLVVKLTGAKLVAATTTDLKPDEGHLHVTLDDQLLTMTSGTSYLIPDVAPGQHLLKVEFVANDHAPFDPRVIAAVSFTVKAS
jgi:Family of unknown function (DUF6130)